MLIINFYTLFKASVTDRFALNYNFFWCLSEHMPWDCPTSNILQELLWRPKPSKEFPNARWIDPYWFDELDFINIGDHMLHKMIVQNTNIKCLQQNVFFVPNEKTNPIICYSLNDIPGPKSKWWMKTQDFLFLDYKSTQPYQDLANKYGDVVHYKLSRGGDIVLLSHPKELQHIFESPIYYKRMPLDYSDYTYGRIAGFKNNTYVMAPSNGWGDRTTLMRNLLLKGVSRKGASNYFPIFNKFSKHLVRSLIANGKKSKKYNPLTDIRTYYEACQCESLFGKEECDRDTKATRQLFDGTNVWLDTYASFIIWKKPYDNILLTFTKKTLDKNMDHVHDFFKGAIDRRKASKPTYNDWLDEFLFGNINGDTLTETEVYAISADSMFGAMPANPFTTNWGMFLLSRHPEVLQKAYKELIDNIGNADLDAGNLHKLPYLNAVVHEIFRHYPGGGAIQARMSMTTDVLDDYHIPDQTNFIINALHIHRDSRFWENPDTFDPERWITTPLESRNPYTFINWGSGGKGCPGRNLAIIQQTVVWADLIRSFEKFEFFGEIPSGKNEPEVLMTLFATPKHPLYVRVTPRAELAIQFKDEL
jgi:cytochrome P450